MTTRRILIILLGLVIVLGGLAWLNRKALILYAAANMGRVDVAANQPITWATGPDSAAGDDADRPPNIILIVVDDLGYNDISTFGGGVADGSVETPNIDRLARDGAVFSNGYAGNATCAPSRAMIMTGRYATRTGFEFTPTPPNMGRIVTMFANDGNQLHDAIYDRAAAKSAPDFAEQGLPGSEVTIAELLKQVDYHTVHIGKWHLGRGAESLPNAQGFDESLLMASGLYLPENDPGVVNAKVAADPIDKFLWARMQYAASFNNSEWFEPDGYLTDYYTREARKVIEANANRPFFLYLAHWGVHSPLQASKADYDALDHIEDHRLRVYAAMIRAIDRSVGEIIDTVEAESLTENTLIIFTSDNGGPGYIGLPDINAPYRGWKLTFFEGGIRVPFFFRWPGQIPAGTRYAEPATHIDLLPTLAAAAGTSLPADRVVDGENLLPLLTNQDATDPMPSRPIFWQSGYYRSVLYENWKLQVSERPAKAWLYNLAQDPTEQVNLADSEPERLAQLQALIDGHQADARPALYPYTVEAPVLVDKTIEEPATADDEYIYWPN